MIVFLKFFLTRLLVQTLLFVLIFVFGYVFAIFASPIISWPFVGYFNWNLDQELFFRALKWAVISGGASGVGMSFFDVYLYLKGCR